jgi:hypothetical protein
VCGVQVVPFQLSETGMDELPPPLPTATHRDVVGQDTSERVVSISPEGRGRFWADQLVPFQNSASGV